jgi:hypothetical protein
VRKRRTSTDQARIYTNAEHFAGQGAAVATAKDATATIFRACAVSSNEATAALIPDRTGACGRFAVRAREAIPFVRDNTVFFITVYFSRARTVANARRASL